MSVTFRLFGPNSFSLPARALHFFVFEVLYRVLNWKLHFYLVRIVNCEYREHRSEWTGKNAACSQHADHDIGIMPISCSICPQVISMYIFKMTPDTQTSHRFDMFLRHLETTYWHHLYPVEHSHMPVRCPHHVLFSPMQLSWFAHLVHFAQLMVREILSENGLKAEAGQDMVVWSPVVAILMGKIDTESD